MQEADIPPIVDAAWCREHSDDLSFCDVRWSLTEGAAAGRAAYATGHIPGAVFVDLDSVLAAPANPREGRHPLPSPSEFAGAMAALGVNDADVVVAYDDNGGAWAARLVWMLRVTGRNAALLDGGIGAWDGPLSVETPERPRGLFRAVPWPNAAIASIRQVASRGDDTRLVDVRAAERFSGATEPVDPRAGHVPGATNLPLSGNLDADGRFLSGDDLRARYRSAGVTDGAETIIQCGSGVSACHGALAMERAGLGRPRVWVGSWSQWSSDLDLPMETGA